MATRPPTSQPGPANPGGKETRQRLLQAAGEVFAEHGYRNATIRDISRRARANIAAVNYHFGDKERLYHAVLEYTARFALEKYPPTAGVRPEDPPAERLRAFIRNMLDRMLDEGRPAWHGQLMSREMVEPTSMMDQLVIHFVRPQFERLYALMGELIGPGATQTQLRHAAMSVVGQVLFYKHAAPVISRLTPEQKGDAAGRAALTEHITSFSLAGLEAMRRAGGGRKGDGRSGGGEGVATGDRST